MNTTVDRERVRTALKKTTTALLSEMNSAGHWSGELSSSALSTAVAVIALHRMGQTELVNPGLRWLADHANPDGGWGDTVRSQSNLSTTALVWAAFGATHQDACFRAVVDRSEQWLRNASGSLEKLPQAIINRYGKDRTFSVPILMTLALSGRLCGEGWRLVVPLPFELAALPQSWFGALRLPVVSYALPALIAIGQSIHHHAPSRNPFIRFIRDCVKETTLGRLDQLQPPNGGFLEATPLTAFVTMSLAGMGRQEHSVAQHGAAFLRASIREDGSWPIDTNLATWVTTLAVKALAHQPEVLSIRHRRTIREWLLGQQYQTVHPYTGAAPGGWAWTDLPGGVPDADDTAGALLALARLGDPDEPTVRAVQSGLIWLLNLQNRDGGIPTFCRGWGTLPFDRSSPELTAHAMQAWACWRQRAGPILSEWIDRALRKADRYLQRSQRSDGAWIPLWFGNENAPEHENPVYGTSRSLIGLEVTAPSLPTSAVSRAKEFLQRARLKTGGWAGDTQGIESIEETAIASEALGDPRGINRLLDLIDSDTPPAPIGLYFARLWYFEKLYPLIFATSALGRFVSKEL